MVGRMRNIRQMGHGRAVRQSCILLLLAIGIAYANADTLVDPTRPANAPTKSTAVRGAEPVSLLTAVFKSGDRRVAVLDGRVVKNGDRIGDIVIQEILADSVRYTRAGRVEIARLPTQAAVVRNDADRNDTARNEAGRKDGIRQEISP
jgi:MSHA biogenesis protein MshK